MFKFSLFFAIPFLAFFADPPSVYFVLMVGAFCLLWPDAVDFFKQETREQWRIKQQEPLYIEVRALLISVKAYWLRRLHVWSELPVFHWCRSMCL